jgi:hypothetical protein
LIRILEPASYRVHVYVLLSISAGLRLSNHSCAKSSGLDNSHIVVAIKNM